MHLLAHEDLEEGTVISTNHQTQGIGQQGTSWESDPHANVTLSVVLKPHFLQPTEQFYLNKAVSYAVFQLLDKLIPGRVAIKWPNDIYVDDDKIAGILIQNIIKGQKYEWAVVGIGINVRQQVFSRNTQRATSLALKGINHLSISGIQQELFDRLETTYDQLKIDKTALDDRYLKAIYRSGVIADFKVLNGGFLLGKIGGVDAGGRLIVEDLTSALHHFNLKEISFA